MRREIKLSALEKVLWQADIDDDQVRLDYSGRGMYGQACFGFTGTMEDYTRFVVAMLTHYTPERESECSEDYAIALGQGVRTDSMGRDMIFYFPDFRVID